MKFQVVAFENQSEMSMLEQENLPNKYYGKLLEQ